MWPMGLLLTCILGFSEHNMNTFYALVNAVKFSKVFTDSLMYSATFFRNDITKKTGGTEKYTAKEVFRVLIFEENKFNAEVS